MTSGRDGPAVDSAGVAMLFGPGPCKTVSGISLARFRGLIRGGAGGQGILRVHPQPGPGFVDPYAGFIDWSIARALVMATWSKTARNQRADRVESGHAPGHRNTNGFPARAN